MGEQRFGGGGGRPAGGTTLVVAAGVAQLLGFAIPVVVSTVTETGASYEFQWSYEAFSLSSPGLAELFFYLPVTGIVTLIAAFLPTRFLRPVVISVIGAVSLLLLYRDTQVQAAVLERLSLFGWEADKASALKAVALLALAVGGGVLATHAPTSIAVPVALLAAAPALVYLGAPLPSEFPGGFAWEARYAEVMDNRPPEVEAGWSVVTGYYILVGALALDLLSIGVGAVSALVSLRPAWRRASVWTINCVVVSLGTSVLVVVGRAVQPLYDVNYEVGLFVTELTYNLKMLLATLGIVALLPAGVIDLAGRLFGCRS